MFVVDEPTPSSLRATAAAAAVTIACVLPVFLTGAMAVQVSADLGFGAAELGVAMASFVAAQGVLSRFLGQWADRVGAPTALRVASTMSALSAVAAAVLVRDWIGLALALAAAGMANALGQPSASRLVARSVRQDRQGIAFGAFQSSKPVAGVLGGLAVPAIALTVGWRWAFASSAALSFAALSLIPPSEADNDRRAAHYPTSHLRRDVIAMLAAGMALGFGSVTVFSAFIVDAGVRAGMSASAAGLLLAGGGVLAIASRLVVGVVADRRDGEQLRLVSVMLFAGSAGFVLLAVQEPVTIVAGTVLVAMGAWGYNGLFYLSMTRLLRESPAAITGVMMAASSVGGVISPVLFGVIVERHYYVWGWALVAVFTVLGGAAVGWAASQMRTATHSVLIAPED